MEHPQISTQSADSRRVLTNLSFAIDEARLVRKIVELSDDLHRIELQPDSSDRARFIRREIAHLELELTETRILAKAS